MLALSSYAIEIPKASGKALGVTKGKSFDAGIVFVNGKYLPPPYVVERWGVGIRINGVPVIGQVVGWSDMLKTQAGVKMNKTEKKVLYTPPPIIQKSEPLATETTTSDADSLDDLFDDEPKAKPKAATAKTTVVARPPEERIVTTVSYSIDGDFVANGASDALLRKVKNMRTEIDGKLRAGGLICFGDRYSFISADSRMALQLLDKLPGIMRTADNYDAFASKVNAENMVYLTPFICEELYKNRLDYRMLQERGKKVREAMTLKKLLTD